MSYAPETRPGNPPAGADPYAPPFPNSSPNQGCGWTTCLLGCLGVLLISGLLFCGGAWYVYNNAGKWGADLARNVIVGVVEASELTPEEKQGIIVQVDRVTDAYKQGKITFEEVGQVMQSLGESPLFPMIVVYGVEEQYIKNSGLTDEEKAEARLTLQRVIRGIFEQTISEQEFEPVLDDVSFKKPDGQRQIKEQLTDAELRAFLAKAKQLADDKGIPDEEFKVDIVGEVKKAVDKHLSGKGL